MELERKIKILDAHRSCEIPNRNPGVAGVLLTYLLHSNFTVTVLSTVARMISAPNPTPLDESRAYVSFLQTSPVT